MEKKGMDNNGIGDRQIDNIVIEEEYLLSILANDWTITGSDVDGTSGIWGVRESSSR